jgi:predicted cupin superfamily sugar epimerase
MNANAKYWIEKLQMEPHPEGGYFRQTYRADLILPQQSLPGFAGARAASTAIYFLLEDRNFSAFHRLKSDEVWHFYAGAALDVHVLDAEGKHAVISLGTDLEAAQLPQAVVRAGCWFGSHVQHWTGWALVGCTVAPGFDFADFELGKREELEKDFPQHREIVRKLTRE